MFIVYIWTERQWKIESVHGSAEEAEFARIERSYVDNIERDIKRCPLGFLGGN